MTDFKPGDRVTDGKRIGVVAFAPDLDHRVVVEYDKGLRGVVHQDKLRPAYQTCKDCDGTGDDRDQVTMTRAEAEGLLKLAGYTKETSNE